jgi:hypothetical protein
MPAQAKFFLRHLLDLSRGEETDLLRRYVSGHSAHGTARRTTPHPTTSTPILLRAVWLTAARQLPFWETLHEVRHRLRQSSAEACMSDVYVWEYLPVRVRIFTCTCAYIYPTNTLGTTDFSLLPTCCWNRLETPSPTPTTTRRGLESKSRRTMACIVTSTP